MYNNLASKKDFNGKCIQICIYSYCYLTIHASISITNRDDSSEERDDSFPLWLSACQWCAILGLISMATSFLLQFVCLFNACSKSRALRVASMVMIGIAGMISVEHCFQIRLNGIFSRF